MDPILPFLALGDAAHPVHRCLIANLGLSECRWEYGSIDEKSNLRPDLLKSAKSVRTHVVHCKMTSSGKMIFTYKVEIINEMHQPQLSYVRKLLEEPTPYDDMDDESWFQPEKDMTARITATSAIVRAGMEVSESVIVAPDEGMHEQFCALLNYDAPLHHTNVPTIPSTLHLACHQIYADEKHSATKSLYISDVSYHAQLKLNQLCRCTVYSDLDGEEGSYISILRVIDGDGNDAQILSTVLFYSEEELSTLHLTNSEEESRNYKRCITLT